MTGGSRGIGFGIAKLFVAHGAKVIITAKDYTRLKRAAKELGATYIKADARNDLQVEQLITQVIKKFKKIDILVNNLGIFPKIKMLHEIKESEWNDVIDVNLTGIFRFTKHVIIHMMKNGGSIINISSDAGLKAFVGFNADAYSASKAALIMLTKCWAIEYAKSNVRVNCICPGVVNTDMAKPFISTPKDLQMMEREHPIGRIGTPEDVANAALYFASDDSSWTTGAILAVDGGESTK